jgi:DNA polymerase I-like protein with 3'-5' exonuclease and polymerase domains
MQILTIDFETYYDRTYSLSKVTTEEYIRDELFEAIGVSVKINDEPAQWFSGTKAATKKWLDQWDWDNSIAVAHNAVFDMAILNWHFDIRPKRIVDTLSMLRAIDGPDAGNSLAKAAERYGLGVKGDEVINALGKGRLDFTPEEMARYAEYCCNDADLTYDLFQRIAVGFPQVEFRLIDLTLRMFTEPVLGLDKGVLEGHLADVQAKKEALMAKLNYDKAELMSNPKLAELLAFHGVDVPMKISPATGKETYAFAKNDEAFKALLEHENPQVQAIVAARLGVKSTLEETRTERFIKIAERGTLPVPLRYYAAHTGRWGGDDKVNLQNLPRKSPLKKAIRAPEGYSFIDCDSSQIEARTLAWLAGQDDLVAAFDRGEDVYKIMASSIYGVPVDEVTDPQRFVGKTTILGCGYGMGAAKFQAQLKTFNVDMPESECKRIIAVYRETYPMIPRLWRQTGDALEAMANNQTAPIGRDGVLLVYGKDGIKLPNGLSIKYPNMRYIMREGKSEMVYDQKKGRAIIPTRIYGGKAVENICQALARIVIGEQMLMVARRLRVVMTVHDAVGAIAPTGKAAEAREYVEQCMRIRPKWATLLPLNCESKMGVSYGG